MAEHAEELSNNSWQRRIPRSLVLPWEGANAMLNMMAGVSLFAGVPQRRSRDDACGGDTEKREAATGPAEKAPTDRGETGPLPREAQRRRIKLVAAGMASYIVMLNKTTAFFEQVEDELAASANGIEEWSHPESGTSVIGASAHELVFSLAQSLADSLTLAVLFERLKSDPEWDDAYLDDLEDSLDELFSGEEKEKIKNAVMQHWEACAEAMSRDAFPTRGERGILKAKLKQEVCRAADRRLITKRAYPGDERPLTEEEVRHRQRMIANTLFLPAPVQASILEALDGRALKKEPLAEACKVDPSRLYRPKGLKELMEMGYVEKERGIGYYRPDAPPPNTLESQRSPDSPQAAPKVPPTSP